MRNLITTVLKVAIVLTIAFVLINPNPALAAGKCGAKCPEKHDCIEWGSDGAYKCVLIDCCDDSVCKNSTKCIKLDECVDAKCNGVCASDADSKIAKTWLKARAKRRANYRSSKARKALEEQKAAAAELAAKVSTLKADSKAKHAALIAAIGSYADLLAKQVKESERLSNEAQATWNATSKMAIDNAVITDQRLKVFTARNTLETLIKEASNAITTTQALLAGTPSLDDLTSRLTTLKSLSSKLTEAHEELRAKHKILLLNLEADYEGQINEAEKDRAKAKADLKKANTGLRPHEIGVMAFFLNMLPTEEMADSDAQMAFARLFYHHHFMLDKVFRPWVGGAFEAGSLPDGRGYAAPVFEVGFRVGNPDKAFFFEAWADLGWRVGFYEHSGNHWFAGGGIGPGFNLSNKGSLMFGPCYTSSAPGFTGNGAGYEDHILGICLKGSGSANNK